MGLWLVDLEAFEEVSQDDVSRRLALRLAQLFREGRLVAFLADVTRDAELAEDTRSAIAELAEDESFLLAVEEYLGRTSVLH